MGPGKKAAPALDLRRDLRIYWFSRHHLAVLVT